MPFLNKNKTLLINTKILKKQKSLQFLTNKQPTSRYFSNSSFFARH